MARKPQIRKIDLDLLAKIAEATNSEAGMLYVSEADSERLVAHGLAEINVTMTDDNGNVATRTTEEGNQKVSETNETPETEEPEAKAKPSFELETGVELPKARRGGRGATVYPFDAMEVGHSFHVPATEDKPNPAKSLASTVSSATARYAVPDENGATRTNRKGKEVPVMHETRKFVVRSVGSEDPKGPGARIFRTA